MNLIQIEQYFKTFENLNKKFFSLSQYSPVKRISKVKEQREK